MLRNVKNENIINKLIKYGLFYILLMPLIGQEVFEGYTYLLQADKEVALQLHI